MIGKMYTSLILVIILFCEVAMADLYKTNFKAQTPGEEPLGSIFDLLTPEEKAQYAKSFQPTQTEQAVSGFKGLADVIGGAFNNRNPTYQKDYDSKIKGRMDQDMQFVGNELTRKYAERQAKAAAEKAGKERDSLIGTLNKDLPEGYFEPGLTGESGQHIWDKLTGYQNQQKVQSMKPKPQGRAPKDLSYWWSNTAKSAISDPRVKPLYEARIGNQEVNVMLDEIKNGNTTAAASLGKKVATAMGEGSRTTDEDVKRYVTSGKLSQAAGDKLSKWFKGVPTDATQEEIGQMVNALSGIYNDTVVPIYNEHVERAANIQGIPYEEAAIKLNLPGSTYYNRKSSAATPTVVKKGYNSKTDETQLIYDDGTKKIVKGRQ